MLSKEKISYFSHDIDMRNDLKIRGLRKKFGNNGYAVWCYLLEVLTDTPNFSVTKEDFPLLAADFDVSEEEFKGIIEYCLSIKLLQQDGDEIFSTTHRERLFSTIANIRKKSQDAKRAINARWGQKEKEELETPNLGGGDEAEAKAETTGADPVSDTQGIRPLYDRNTTVIRSDTPTIRNDTNKIRLDKIRKNYYYYFSKKEKEKEKEEILKILFFRNIRAPQKELGRLIDYNNLYNRALGGWERMSLSEQLSAARLWIPKTKQGGIIPCDRVSKKGLELWSGLYDALSANGCNCEEMLSDSIAITVSDSAVTITCPASVRQLIESNIPHVKPIFDKFAPRRKIQYLEAEN